MKAIQVKEELSFKRGQDPHEKLSVGDGRSLEELVEEVMKKTDDDFISTLSFDDLNEHVFETYEDLNPKDILKEKHKILTKLSEVDLVDYLESPEIQWKELHEILSKMPKDFQVKWWVEWLP